MWTCLCLCLAYIGAATAAIPAAKTASRVGGDFRTSTNHKLVEQEWKENVPLRTPIGASQDGERLRHMPKQYSGYFKLNRTHEAELFYLYYESRGSPKEDPVVLWMTGGPGCSSLMAALGENGPYHLEKNLTLTVNPYGWDRGHNLIYVDQPVNTGFSYSNDPADEVTTEEGVANDMHNFLVEFFDAHPELADNDFYIAGESYGGHYVPAVSYKVWTSNMSGKYANIPLKGFSIGNGLTDPSIQYAAYNDFAVQNKMIDQATYEDIQQYVPNCKETINVCNYVKTPLVCEAAIGYCQTRIVNAILKAAGNVNVYNIRKQCTYKPLCYDFNYMSDYFNDPKVKKALGAKPFLSWKICSMKVNEAFIGDFMRDYAPLVPPMLQDGIRVLLYAGRDDFICNYLGNSRWADALDWSGSSAYHHAPTLNYTMDGNSVGTIREAHNFAFMVIDEAGHMVPMDQPGPAYHMIRDFTSGAIAGGDPPPDVFWNGLGRQASAI